MGRKLKECFGGKWVYVLDKDSGNFPSSLSPPLAPKLMHIACRKESEKICIRKKKKRNLGGNVLVYCNTTMLHFCIDHGEVAWL